MELESKRIEWKENFSINYYMFPGRDKILELRETTQILRRYIRSSVLEGLRTVKK